ncbi:cystathionine gamma-synthase [Escherichia coli]|uniref:Cystathionine gamma-synthase n=1 Tax=Escherichia coli TaxID=562 RepID=A0A377CD46_ECOLX|nr:cystathionine gamma-synthase [Escherichia coli]
MLHSCTKYLNGHSDVVAGVVIAKDPDVVTELAWWANNIGVTGGAFDSYLLLRGLRTLVPAYGAGAAQRAGDCEIPANPAVGEKTVSPVVAGKSGA